LPFGQIKKSCWYFIGEKQVRASFLSLRAQRASCSQTKESGGELSLYLWALMTNKFQPDVERGWSGNPVALLAHKYHVSKRASVIKIV
jgi:hypothetical protein